MSNTSRSLEAQGGTSSSFVEDFLICTPTLPLAPTSPPDTGLILGATPFGPKLAPRVVSNGVSPGW